MLHEVVVPGVGWAVKASKSRVAHIVRTWPGETRRDPFVSTTTLCGRVERGKFSKPGDGRPVCRFCARLAVRLGLIAPPSKN